MVSKCRRNIMTLHWWKLMGPFNLTIMCDRHVYHKAERLEQSMWLRLAGVGSTIIRMLANICKRLCSRFLPQPNVIKAISMSSDNWDEASTMKYNYALDHILMEKIRAKWVVIPISDQNWPMIRLSYASLLYVAGSPSSFDTILLWMVFLDYVLFVYTEP